jgi:hypothetical protein
MVYDSVAGHLTVCPACATVRCFGSVRPWAAAVRNERGRLRALVHIFFAAWQTSCSPRSSEACRARFRRLLDRHLTVGPAVIGEYAAPRAGPERHAGLGEAAARWALILCLDAAWCSGSMAVSSVVLLATARARLALVLALGRRLQGSEPGEVRMVRRRSTVRFRKGAPQNPSSETSSWAAGRGSKIA